MKPIDKICQEECHLPECLYAGARDPREHCDYYAGIKLYFEMEESIRETNERRIILSKHKIKGRKL